MRRLITMLALIAAPLCAAVAQQDARTPMPRPDTLRGLYVNRWSLLNDKIWKLIDVAKTTEVNALVIDVKDDRGLVTYPSSVPLARRIGADTVNPVPLERMRAVLDTMRANGIFPIARIVVAKDPTLANAQREWAVRQKSDGKPMLDENGHPWLDAHHRGVWAYAGDLAAEAVALGFSEVQFDYVRFPDEPRMIHEAMFPLAKGRTRARVIGDQLAYLHQRMHALHVPMSIDVFGYTTSDSSEMGIGQRWEIFAKRADIVQPMTYPSHYSSGSYGIPNPNANPYAVIDHAMQEAKRRNARLKHPPRIVPWYQDFTMGDPPYGVEQLRAQMKAGYDNGIASWILWNAGSEYTIGALAPDRSPASPARF